jgi:hypothetical protein
MPKIGQNDLQDPCKKPEVTDFQVHIPCFLSCHRRKGSTLSAFPPLLLVPPGFAAHLTAHRIKLLGVLDLTQPVDSVLDELFSLRPQFGLVQGKIVDSSDTEDTHTRKSFADAVHLGSHVISIMLC